MLRDRRKPAKAGVEGAVGYERRLEKNQRLDYVGPSKTLQKA